VTGGPVTDGPVTDGRHAEDRGGGPADAYPPELSIVIPAFNEGARLDLGFARLRAAVDGGAMDPAVTELVVVDDGSTDGTGERAHELLAPFPRTRVLRLPENAGKGAAIRAGVAVARGRVTIFADADMAIDPLQIPLFVNALDRVDVAIGSRSITGAHAEGDTIRRTVMGHAFNVVVNALTDLSLGDTQCGFKAFRTPVARLLFHCTVTDRFAFDVELLSIARRLGLPIVEVPVRWRHIRGGAVHPLRDPVSMVSDVLRSRVGLRTPRPVDGVIVSAREPAATLAAEVRRVLGATDPVAPWHEGGILVLLPLCRPADVEGATARLRATFPPHTVHPVRVTVSQLATFAPLAVLAAPPPHGDPGRPGDPCPASPAGPPPVAPDR